MTVLPSVSVTRRESPLRKCNDLSTDGGIKGKETVLNYTGVFTIEGIHMARVTQCELYGPRATTRCTVAAHLGTAVQEGQRRVATT